MITVPPLFPLDTKSRELIKICLELRTTAGFIAKFEENWERYGKKKAKMGTAYEQTEMLYNHLFGQRRYKDREVFYNKRWQFYSK